jgi:hypothetical protein
VSQPQEPTEEQLIEALRRVKVDDVLVQTVATLVNLAGQKLTVPEAKDPVEAKKAIDAARAMSPLLSDDAAAAVRDALAQVQMLYVKETGEGPAAAGDAEQPAGDAEARQAEAREAEERAKARSKIWTPGS